jgi:hypothetical protein
MPTSGLLGKCQLALVDKPCWITRGIILDTVGGSFLFLNNARSAPAGTSGSIRCLRHPADRWIATWLPWLSHVRIDHDGGEHS